MFWSSGDGCHQGTNWGFLMRFSASRFQTSLLRLPNDVRTLWWALVPRRSDDAAELGDLDRVWRAECEEMDAILGRKDPGRFRK